MIGAAAKPITDVAEATGADVALLPLAIEAQALRTVAKGRSDLKELKSDAKARLAPPTTDELAMAARQAYQRAKDAGAVAAPQGYARMASGVRTSLREQGFNPRLHPKAAAVVEEIEKTSSGAPVAFDELEILRRQALAAERSIEADERRVAGLIIDRLDDYADALASGAEPVLGGNAPAAVAARKGARSLYARNRKSMEIGELMERARVRASQFSGSGEENALRTEFRQLAMNAKRLRRFSPEEQRAIKEVAFGTPTRNALRQIGKLAPTGGLSQWLGIGATMINPLAATVPAAGAAARYGATRMTRSAAQRAEELMRRGPVRQAEQAQGAPVRSQADEIDLEGEAFEAERAAAAQAARGGYEVGELPAEEITLERRPQNRLQQLSPIRNAARTAVATKTQSTNRIAQLARELEKRKRLPEPVDSASNEFHEDAYRSAAEHSEPARMASLLAQHDDAFKYARSDQKDFTAVMRKIAPDMKVKPENWGGDTKKAFRIEHPTEGDATVVWNKEGTVELGISKFTTGQRGSAIYQAVGDFAANNGLKFIGDPLGLSPIAQIRRTDNMLSSALRHGSTKHLGIHEKQANPQVKGVRPINWKEGDDDHNFNELAQSVVSTYGELVPEIKGIRYNGRTEAFEDVKGNVISDSDFERMARHARETAFETSDDAPRGLGRTPPVGRNTLKRVAFLQSGLRSLHGRGLSADGKQRGQHDKALPNALKELLYGAAGVGVATGLSESEEREPRRNGFARLGGA